MQCGEAVVPVSWPVEQVVLVSLLRTHKKVGHSRAHKIQGRHLNRFLRKDRTRFSKLFHIVLLCLISIVVRIAPITAPRQAEKILLESLFGCASGPCLHVETHVVRTSATLRTTAFASVARRNR